MSQDEQNKIINEELRKYADKLQMEAGKLIAKYKIGKTGALQRSFKTTVGNNEVSVIFNEYGRFVDMGVGREFPIGTSGAKKFKQYRNKKGQLLVKPKRKPKPWYSSSSYGGVALLKANVSKKLIDLSINNIKNNIENSK